MMKEEINVLMVDDDREDYILTREALREADGEKQYKLDWASDYESALDQISQRLHDIYLVDYRMGPHSGLDIIRKAIKMNCDAPLILLTGQGDRAIDQEAMDSGASDYIVKGTLNSLELERALRYNLRHAQNSKQINELNTELEQKVCERTANLMRVIKEKEEIEQNLRKSQELYSAIAKNFPNGLVGILNKNFIIEFAEGSELTKLKDMHTQLTGKNLFQFIPDEQKELVKKHLIYAFLNNTVNFEFVISESFYSVVAVPLSDAENEIKQLLIVIENISERKKTEEKMQKALQKEKELNEFKSRFVTMASHEFRTPLSTILSSVNLLITYNQKGDKENYCKHINRIKSGINNLTEILNSFLSLQKLEEGKLFLNPSTFSLPRLMEETVKEIQAIAAENQVILYEHLNEHPSNAVMLDKKLLQNIMINLLSNAVKYSPPGKEIRVTSQNREEKIIIEVKDSGIGIPESEQNHLFERFFRAGNVTNIQGTGLGLNIVKKYVEMMQGEITFSSREHVGTTFTVYLPQLKQI